LRPERCEAPPEDELHSCRVDKLCP
jgi:hypothetical protein